jgi:hypothetical protein
VGARKKARQWIEDGETNAEEIGKAAEKIKQQAKNYREITSKYKVNIEQKEQQDKKTIRKQKQNRKKQIQTKKIAGGTPGHELARNH